MTKENYAIFLFNASDCRRKISPAAATKIVPKKSWFCDILEMLDTKKYISIE